MFEEQVIMHCSPTLAGIKMAGLFNYYYKSKPDFIRELKQCADKLKDKGVSIAILYETDVSSLVYVYRKKLLCAGLNRPEVSAFLETFDDAYGENGADCCTGENSWQFVSVLRHRFRKSGGFPHEIGVFLGYPLADVIGFIENEGRDYKCSGCWKVYSDETAAQCLFCKYKKCREVYYRLFRDGRSLRQLTVTA